MSERDRTRVWQPERYDPGGAADDSARVVEPVRPGGAPQPASQVNVKSTAGPQYRYPSAARLVVWRAQRAVFYIFGVIEAIVAIRFILKLLGANPANQFTQLVYNVSWIFVFPFNNVLPNASSSGFTLETFSLVAIGMYILVSLGVAKLFDLLVP
ncbi:MAG: YggT family protein [Chloroflexota bacterium]|nr:YggT family protein [Chloroflexota bacterium]